MQRFEFRVSSYYADLVDWSDPDDPLRRIVLPRKGEIVSELELDPSDEAGNTRVPGLQHKYGPTALLLVADVCSSYCRFCFRKRFTLATDGEGHIRVSDNNGHGETTMDISAGVDYIAAHPEIDNVLLTGGDPLMLSTRRLDGILCQLRAIPHVRVVRIGSKLPAFDPERIDGALVEVLSKHNTPGRGVAVIAHFNHPRELTALALSRLDALLASGIQVRNQTPLLRGVNDDPEVLAELFGRLADRGVVPYYLFHCRLTQGNESFLLSLQEGLEIVTRCRAALSGLAKTFRYVASDASGKLELLGRSGDQLVMRYHEARDPAMQDRLLTCPADRPVLWPDEAVAELGGCVPSALS